MRAPFQVLVFPYRIEAGRPLYAVLKRADDGAWQGVAGGGEADETPEQAAARELTEETGMETRELCRLDSVAYLPVASVTGSLIWGEDVRTIPEYCFGALACDASIELSSEHVDAAWLPYERARGVLAWGSNRAALGELHERLLGGRR